MIHSHIDDFESYRHLLTSPLWKRAFDWLYELKEWPEPGTHTLEGKDLFANVMRYNTPNPQPGRFESHRKYADIQYTFSGGEIIAWRRNNELTSAEPYCEANDVQFYKPSESTTRLHMPARHLCIFFPTDAHHPGLADGVNGQVQKVVVKVRLDAALS